MNIAVDNQQRDETAERGDSDHDQARFEDLGEARIPLASWMVLRPVDTYAFHALESASEYFYIDTSPHLCQQAAGEGACLAAIWHFAESACEGPLGISMIAPANAWPREFIAGDNQRFVPAPTLGDARQ
jgi:hypothetical protein